MRMALAIAAAEARSLSRMPRTWLLAATTFGVGFVTFFAHAMFHHMGYTDYDHSPSTSGVAPAFMVSGFGGLALWTALAGSALLAFDARSRDRRAGIAETLDARPVSNLEVLAGRLVAVVLVAWLPLLAMVGALQTAQWLGDAALSGGWFLGGAAELLSLVAFLVVDAPTALILMVSAVTLVAAALGIRSLVAAVALAVAGALFWSGFHTPLYLLPATFGPVAFGSVASDILPDFADGRDVVQRASLLVAASGMLVAAAACHGRRDAPSRVPGLCAGAVLVAAGVGGVGALVWLASAEVAERDMWTAAHRELRNAPRADIESVSGRVRIEPGALLEIDVALGLRLPPEEPSRFLTLSLNPGLCVESLRVGGEKASYRHELGILKVDLPPLPATPNAPVDLALRASGVPDARFAYLDSALDATRLTLAGSELHLLGTEAALFEDDYVALMPGARWLPTPGANFASDDPTAARRDFFGVDLEVEVPKGWLAAGPGLREEIAGDEAAARFRFQPAAPVHEVAILAADFARRATAAHGVELELLMHREHIGNLAPLASAASEIASRIDTAFEAFSDSGLAYPYRGLSVVETPGRLRGYGGGWRMDTVQSLPGMVLLREHGFPTALLQELRLWAYVRRQSLGSRLASYFANDLGGGDPTRGVMRNLLAFQTAAHQGADAVDFVVAELVQKQAGAWTQSVSATPFSANAYVGESKTFFNLLLRAVGTTFFMRFAPPRASTPAAWDRIADGSVAGLAASDHGASRSAAEALDAWLLRGGIVADALHDVLGAGSPAVLAELRRRHAGGGFSAADFDAVASDLGMPLEPGIGDWLRETELPGFLVSPMTVTRLADDDRGRPRYQMKLHVRNDEPTSGLVRLQAFPEQPDPQATPTSEPVRVAGNAAVEIGLVHSSPPEAAMVKTYLSLNRGPVYVAAPRADATAAHRAAPLEGARPSDWQPRWKDWIVVDDLDAGFRVDERPDAGLLRSWRRADAADEPQDAGLPAYRLSPALPGRWLRETTRWGWGRYRRTIARAEPGDGRSAAVFVADIPRTGRWRLDYHLPPEHPLPELDPDSYATSRRDNLGRYRMSLVAGGGEQAIEFDAGAGEVGWNRIGEYRLEAGEVRLSVSSQTSGDLVVADAIRWRSAAARDSAGQRETESPSE